MATGPGPVPANLAQAVRRLGRRNNITKIAAPVAAAAVFLVAVGIWQLSDRASKETSMPSIAQNGQTQEIAAPSQAEIRELVARTDALVELVHEVLEQERSRQRLAELEAELASIPDPLDEIRKSIDKTAFTLLYQADRMYRELDLKDSAVEAYNRVIELFPENRWADTARQRLSEIENQKTGKGDLLWKPKRA
ncbi:MAG: tetratricopeptide repeat protein [Planctomycetota bacterium]